MEIVQDNIDELNAVLKISVKPEDYTDAYEKVIAEQRKTYSLPGFRAGKVPVGMIKKKHGPGILVDEIQKILNEALDKHIKENDLKILGQPIPKHDAEVGDFMNPSEFEFAYELGLAPQFDLNVGDKDKINWYKIDVEDKMVDEEADRIAKQYGKLVDTDKSEEKDLLYAELTQLDAEGNPMEGGIKNSTTIFVDSIEDKKIKKKFIGLKTDSELVIDPHDLTKNHEDLARMLGVEHNDVHGLISKFNMKVTLVKRVEAAAMDKELFDKVFAGSDIKDEAEFKATLKDRIQAQFDKNSHDLFKKDASEHFINKLKLKLPKEFLIKWTALANDKSEEESAVDYEYHAKGLQWQLILNKIAEENKMNIEFDQVKDFTKNKLIENYAQYGYPEPEEKELEESALKVLQNQEEARRIYDMLLEDQIFVHIKANAKINDKSISFEKFKKMAETE